MIPELPDGGRAPLAAEGRRRMVRESQLRAHVRTSEAASRECRERVSEPTATIGP